MSQALSVYACGWFEFPITWEDGSLNHSTNKRCEGSNTNKTEENIAMSISDVISIWFSFFFFLSSNKLLN